MASEQDYYETLQVHHRADKEIIAAAYRKLAAKYHPDVSQASDALERMKQVNAAYEVLSDPIRRAAYDAARLGYVRPSDTPVNAADPLRPVPRRWRTLLAIGGLTLLAVALLRLAPAILLSVSRLVVPLVAILLTVLLVLALAKPRR